MRIYAMTATFGKLENQTLRLTPGLNVIHAPNEWGKSTWCAFLVAMLYGIDTRERTRQNALADKERYAPWSGSPMSGRMDLCWNGRDITIERSTKGRSILGAFKAYETHTGLPVPELTGENCGQQLLGVEKSVFTRAGFIRMTDLPVSEDDALRRRLNALVTTGDESGESDALAQKLKALKNRCRHNRTGLLPQAEAQRETLQSSLERLRQLRADLATLEQEQLDTAEKLQKLQNHEAALAYRAALADDRRVADAQAAATAARDRYETLQSQLGDLPDKDTAEAQILHLEQLRLQQEEFAGRQLPPIPQAPDVPRGFEGMSPRQALRQAETDRESYVNLSGSANPLLPVLAGVSIAVAAALFFLVHWMAALAPVVLAACLLAFWIYGGRKKADRRNAIAAAYAQKDPDTWVSTAKEWVARSEAYDQEYRNYQQLCDAYNTGKAALMDNVENCTGGLTVSQAIDYWRQVTEQHRQLEQAQQDLYQATQHAKALSAMAKPAAAPAFPDTLTLSPEETRQQLTQLTARQQQLQTLSGQRLGMMESLGQESALLRQLEETDLRIQKLEEIYEASTLAMEFLEQASGQLQRKFAPRIARQAGAHFAALTGNRYDKLVLGEDLTLEVGAAEETVTRSGLWRSEGTADQLYLALRLAVAGELTPDAPLVLDDALVRFDDTRLGYAMALLKTAAADKQVILFTCQSREEKFL